MVEGGNWGLTAARWAHALLALAAMVAGSAAMAQDSPPQVISPLRVETDHNGVNIVSGKTTIGIPALSVPGAGHLRLDRIQNAAPYVSGRISGGPGEIPQASYSVHNGTGSSESFQCPDYDCASVTGTGSTFQHASRIYRQAGSGARWQFNVIHVDTGGPPRVLLYYASNVTYPNGETISYTYETAYLPDDPFHRPFRRPVQISSNTGYYITITYHPGALGEMGWNSPSTAALYASGNPTPLQQLTYSLDGTTITDPGDANNPPRVFHCTGCNNSLGTDLETWAGSTQLPTEAAPARVVAAHPSAPVVSSVTMDGVAWNYSYLNLRFQAQTNSWLYDRVTVTGPNGFNQVYAIGQAGSPTQLRNVITGITDPINRTSTFLFDEASRPYRVVYPEGNQVDVAYDDYGNLFWRRTRPKPGSGQADVIEQAYFPGASLPNLCTVSCWRPTWSRDGLNRQTDYVYDSNGQLTQQDDPADANGVRRRTIVEYAASPGGISRRSVVRVCGVGTTCGTSQEIRTEYQYLGDTLLPTLERRWDLAAGTYLDTTYGYDAAGRRTSTDGPLPGNADATYSRYDLHGRKTWEIGAAAPSGVRVARRFTYRESDNKPYIVESGTIPNENSTALTVQSRTDTAYDNHRNPVRNAVSAGGTTYSVADASFDDRGRLVCTAVRMNPAAFGQAPGACSHTTFDPNHGPDRITYNAYDNAGQRLQEWRAYGVTTANGFPANTQQVYAAYTYSANGTQTSVTDANGNRAEMTWDGFDRQRRWTFPSPTTPGVANAADYEEYGYDAVGNRISLRKRDGSTLTYQYDNLNRMIVKIVPERGGLDPSFTRDVYYAYDLRNLQTEARFDSLSGDGISNTYDAFGRQLASRSHFGTFDRSVTYGYDAGGRRTSVTPDGRTFVYAYDARGRNTLISDGVDMATLAQPVWNDNDTPYGMWRPTAVTYVTSDAVGRLNGLSHNLNGTSGDVLLQFQHNAASQIVQRTRDNAAYSWAGAYNVSRNYTVNGLNQYTAAGPVNLTYDANGNLTSDGTNTYTYDVENRLVARSGGVQLGYDPLGRLLYTTGSPNFTRFLYDGDAMVAEYDYSGNLVGRYIHGAAAGADDPLVWLDSNNLRRDLHADHQGSIIAVGDQSGNPLAINTYDEWGIPGSGNVGRFQYTGQAWMGELGMYYYKARIYSPTLGRFLQVDPIGYDDQINLYAYVGNDPVNGTDPTGLLKCSGDREKCAEVNAAARDARRAALDARREFRNLARAVRAGSELTSRQSELLGAYERRFGEDSGTASNLNRAADHFGGVAAGIGTPGNGMTVAFGTTAQAGGGPAATSPDGRTLTIGPKFFGQEGGIGLGLTQAFTILHEGGHSWQAGALVDVALPQGLERGIGRTDSAGFRRAYGNRATEWIGANAPGLAELNNDSYNCLTSLNCGP